MRRINLWCPIIKWKEIIMWICANPNWKINFNSKNGRKWSFSYETKASISFIPMRRMCSWCPIMKRMRLLCGSIFIPIEIWSSILKMVKREDFLMKQKHQYLLSQWRDCVYGSQLWNEEIVMWIPVYPNRPSNINSKNGRKRSFLTKPKH